MEKETLYIYSGNVREGIVGQSTNLIDSANEKLYVGDIVVTSKIDASGVCYICGLSAVVSDAFTSYSNDTHIPKEGNINYFIMGIKSVDFMGKDSNEWSVKRVKKHSDIINGEKWTDYGFNYKNK